MQSTQNIGLSKELIHLARKKVAEADQQKQGFVDPAMASSGGAPPMDPAMAGGGGGMPMDPAMMGGGGGMPMDPAMMGAAPPMDPAMAGEGGGGISKEEIQAMISEALAAQGAGTGDPAAGGAAGAGGGKKMKVDVNQEIYQIKKLLVMLFEQAGIDVPANLLLGDPAMDPHAPADAAAKDPLSAGASPEQPGGSSIPPIAPIQGAGPELVSDAQKAAADENILHGKAVSESATTKAASSTSNSARALLHLMNRRNK
jgi:hypothetical protein